MLLFTLSFISKGQKSHYKKWFADNSIYDSKWTRLAKKKWFHFVFEFIIGMVVKNEMQRKNLLQIMEMRS